MKHPGGYNLSLAGRPSAQVDVLGDPAELHLPLRSRRFSFTDICVADGDVVSAGSVIARDPANHGVPLLAPRAGTVRTESKDGHIVLSDLGDRPACADEALVDALPGVQARQRLLDMGAWQHFADAHTGALPDPHGAPRAVIVHTVSFEPFTARGDALLTGAFSGFIRGLGHVQSLLEYQPIHLVVPEVNSALAKRVLDAVRGFAWIKVYPVPLRYPADNPRLIMRRLGGFAADAKHPVWATDVAGVLAVDRVLTDRLPCTERTISLAGPAAPNPRHLRLTPGYPLKALLGDAFGSDVIRVIDGGILTGETLDEGQLGLDVECRGLTLLPEATERPFLGFLRPGTDRSSYSRCFLSALAPRLPERLTTALRGERRACVCCTSCERVCPAGIMPHAIHRNLYQDVLEEAERLRVDLCVGCGLCSYVCPSKIELCSELCRAAETIRQETANAEGAEA